MSKEREEKEKKGRKGHVVGTPMVVRAETVLSSTISLPSLSLSGKEEMDAVKEIPFSFGGSKKRNSRERKRMKEKERGQREREDREREKEKERNREREREFLFRSQS